MAIIQARSGLATITGLLHNMIQVVHGLQTSMVAVITSTPSVATGTACVRVRLSNFSKIKK